MKERDVFRRAIGTEILNKDRIRERAVSLAKTPAPDPASTPPSRSPDRIRTRRRWVLAANLVLLAVVVGVIALVTRPYWRPAGDGTTTVLTTNGTTSVPTVTSAPSIPRTANPEVLSTLPDTVEYNVDRDEYYDTAFMIWDAAGGHYTPVQDAMPPASFDNGSVDPDVWERCFTDLDAAPDRLLVGSFKAYYTFMAANEPLASAVSKSSATGFPGEVLDGPFDSLADVPLSSLPRLFRIVRDIGADSLSTYLLANMFQARIARIECPIRYFLANGGETVDDRWSADMLPYLQAWGAGISDYYNAVLAVFRDRVNDAPSALLPLLDSTVTAVEKAELAATYGVAALPFYFEAVLLYGEDGYLPYVHAALPLWLVRREAAVGRLVDASTDPTVIRGYLTECWEEAQGVRATGLFRFADEEGYGPDDEAHRVRFYAGNTSTYFFDGKPEDHDWNISVWARSHPDDTDVGRYAAEFALMPQGVTSVEEVTSLPDTIRFTLATSAFSVAYECDLATREVRAVDPDTGETMPAPEVAAVVDAEPEINMRADGVRLKIIVRFDGPPMIGSAITYTVENYSGSLSLIRQGE